MNSSDKLQIRGQGVIIFEISSYLKGAFRILNNDGSDGLRIEFTKDSLLVNRVGVLEPLIDPKNVKGLSPHDGVYYWVSLDSQNQTILAGIGEPRMDTVAYSYKWNMADANREKNKLFLESLGVLELEANIKILRILRDPVTGGLPLAVKDSSQLTMADVARGDIVPSANLSPMAQKLYNCISGKNFVLNDSDFPDFSKAIEYSIATVGCWCNTRLKEKSREFNKDKPNIEETYLRITLGKNNGESPGVPYVMEIWPVGHYSPIHNHGGSEAIIRVLLGSIHVSLYPYLCGEPTGIPPFKEVSFSQGDITWISPTLNQTHQLKNLKQNTSACITIQCYMYDEKNKAHYDYFDYIDDAGNKLQYEPDSDMEFLEFKEVIRREWNGRRRGWFC
jgi:hypothetical protein